MITSPAEATVHQPRGSAPAVSISWRTSRAAVGSSSTSAVGSWASARASRTRCHSPPEGNRSSGRPAPGHRTARAPPRTAAWSPAPGAARGPRRAYRPSMTASSTRSGNRISSRCGTTPSTRASSARAPATRAAGRGCGPPRASSATSPDSARTSVVLPLPFGPDHRHQLRRRRRGQLTPSSAGARAPA